MTDKESVEKFWDENYSIQKHTEGLKCPTPEEVHSDFLQATGLTHIDFDTFKVTNACTHFVMVSLIFVCKAHSLQEKIQIKYFQAIQPGLNFKFVWSMVKSCQSSTTNNSNRNSYRNRLLEITLKALEFTVGLHLEACTYKFEHAFF